MQLRTRLAPTPSGFLHAGNAFSFVLTWLCARHQNGRIVLRIDDLDSTRKRPEYVADIFASIEWLGIDFDEGPSGPDDFEREYTQRLRLDLYQAALEQLESSGLVFPCACSRSSISAAGGVHPVECRGQTSFHQENTAWRIATDSEPIVWTDVVAPDGSPKEHSVTLSGSMVDFAVRRKDKIPAYQLASLVDDVHFAINFIVRGEDLLESTAAQRLLAKHLEYEEFLTAKFMHHSLFRNSDGSKLSKSAGASSIRAMRELDSTAEEFYRQISARLNLPQAVSSAAEALSLWNERTDR